MSAKFTFKLVAESGYEADGEYAITPEQYGQVVAILNGKGEQPSDKWPIKPLKLVQVTLPDDTSAALVPERPYFSAWAMQELENRLKAQPADERQLCPRGCSGPEQGGSGCLAVVGQCAMDEPADERKDAELRAVLESITDSAEMMLAWCVKNVERWNFSNYDYLHNDVQKARRALAEKGERNEQNS